MKPIETQDCNAVLALPGGTSDNDLHCRVENGWTHSTWEMTDDERTCVLESGAVVAWLWWPNLVGVSLRVDGAERVHTDGDMEAHHQTDELRGAQTISLVAWLHEEELARIREGAHLKLGVDMHPTCPVAVSTYETEG